MRLDTKMKAAFLNALRAKATDAHAPCRHAACRQCMCSRSVSSSARSGALQRHKYFISEGGLMKICSCLLHRAVGHDNFANDAQILGGQNATRTPKCSPLIRGTSYPNRHPTAPEPARTTESR